MESITIKVDEDMAKAIDKAMKPLYGTKTEFIREAIRDKLKKHSKDEVIAHFEKFFGKAKMKVSDDDLREAREQITKKYAQKFGIDLE